MHNPILLFDGVCNLCNGMMKFVLSHEKESVIRFAALQSAAGQKVLEQFNRKNINLKSILYIENDIIYEKSDAAFKIANHLSAPWSWIVFFRFVPVKIRDYLYDLISKHRYRIFGKSSSCMLPDPKWEQRFLQ